MENGSQSTAARGSGSAGALSFDMRSTGPVAPVSSAATTSAPASQAPVDPSALSSAPAPQSPRPSTPKKRRTRTLLAVGIAFLAAIFIGGAVLAFQVLRSSNKAGEQQNISSQFNNVELPLDQLVNQQGINVLGTRSLVINGQLRTNDSLVVAPSSAPSTPTAGQIYYDQGNNQLGYYNGSQFVYLAQSQAAVNSLGGANGDIATGSGLQLVGGTLNNTGVLSFQGQIGAVTLSAGSGVSINGTTITNNGDLTVGNEVSDVVGGSGLLRVGSGTTLNPYKVALQSCANGEILKSSGSGAWACGSDNGTSSTAGNGLQLVGGEFSVNSPTCSGTDKLSWNGTAFVCSADLGGTAYSAGTGLSLVGGVFSNTGTLSVTANGALTSTGGQNPNIAFANGTTAGQYWQWNGSAWVLASLPAEGDGVVGNEITDVTGANSGLVRSGAGTSVSPYTLAVNTGNGLQLSGGAVTILSATCSGTDKLQWTGIGFICSPDTDTNTTYGTITNGGMRLSGTNFGLQICANGEVLQAQAVSGEWGCIAPSSFGVAYTAGNGLGLTGNQFSVNSPTCSGTDKLQWTGTAFQCSNDVNTDAQTLSWVSGTRTLSISNGNSVVIGDSDTTYSAAANGGLSLVGTQFALSVCANGEVMRAQTVSGEWACSADNNTTYTAGTGLNLVGNTFSNSGILTVTGSGAINVTAGQNPTVAFANGSSAGQYWQWNGSSWVLATFSEVDGVIGNEVTNVTGVNSGLARSGSGTSVSPYTLGIMSCANTEILQSSGSGAWACAAPTGVGTSYSIITNGGLRIAGSNFGLKTCTAGQLLQAQATSGEWDCVSSTGVGTSYVAGTGVNITGSTISNTGVLSVIGSGPITSSGGQNPSLDFIDGSANGQFWQWNGSDWVLATLPNEGDAVVGNEVTDVTGANSGLTRSGSGTSGSPYTLAVNAGNGLQLSGGAVLINSPTCSGTTKLQWNGSAFICSTDIDTTYGTLTNGGLRLSGTNFGLQICANGELLQAQAVSGEWSCVAANTVGLAYTAGNGISLGGTQFSINSPTCSGTDKLQWNGTAFVCSADVNTDAQTLTWVSGTRTLSISGGNNVVIGDSDTTYSAAANGGLSLVGTQFALSTCTTNQIMKAQVTSGQWACAADNDTTYTAGTGMSLVGTTFNNSGILSLTGSSNISVTGGQNATVGFVNGSSNGQVWQWNGSAWVLATISAGSVDTLQAGYTASTGGTTPEIKLDSTRGALDIQDANTTIGANLLNVRASNGSGLGATLFSVGNTGVATFQNSTDSTAAFKVLSAAGGNVLNVDTSASKISFGVYADFDSMTKLSNPATLPTQRVIGLSWSPDSQYAVAGQAVDGANPVMYIYKRSGDTFTKLSDPSTMPPSHSRVSSWSPDGTYMSIAHVSSPYVTIYKRSGDTFTKLPNPSSLPTGDAYATAWSPDGQYMTVAHTSSPYITIYKRDGDTFTKLANPSTLPTGTASSVSWSPNGQYMTVGHDTSPYITTYKRTGDTFTKLSDPATLPTGGSGGISTGVAWSPDNTYVVMSHTTSPYMTIYKRSGDTLTKLSDPASLPVGNGTAVSWSPTGNYISVAHQGGSSCDDIYSRSGDTFTKLAEASPAPLGDCRSTSWSPDGRFVLVGNDNAPFFNVYKAGDGGPRVDADIFGKLSVVGTTAITQGNLSVDGNITSTSLISAQAASVTGSVSVGGQVSFKNTADSTTAFQVQDTSGNTILNVNSTSKTVSVGLGSTSSNNAVCSSLANSTSPTAGTSYELRDCSSTPGADYMEMYSVDNGVQTGDIVAPGNTYITTNDGDRVAKLTKSTSAYQGSVIGIASNPENAGDFNSVGHNIKDTDRPFPIALNGRVKVKISESSPAIEPGDYITTSTEAGKGTKATQKGIAVGKALESWTPGTGQATVMVYVNLTQYDPADGGSDLFIEDTLGLGAQEATLSDDGISNDTVTPTASFMRVNQDSGSNAADPTLSLSKANAKDGDLLVIVNSDSSRTFKMVDSSDINVPGSSITIGPDDTVSFIFSKDHWIATSTSDN